MRVTFKIIGFPKLRHLLGEGEIDIEFEGQTVNDMIAHLDNTYGVAAKKTVMQNELSLKPGVRLLRNGCQWIDSDDLETKLSDGDMLVLSLQVAGG